jgi:hypothetical protein
LSGVLVVAQVAVALMLLTGAGLLIHSFAEALKVDPGLEPRNVVTARIALTREHRASDQAALAIRERLLQAMKEIPGVTSVALSASTPFQGGLPINAFALENDTLPPGAPQPGAFRVIVTPGYAETLGLKVVEGRFYEEADVASQRRLFVVDQSFARKFFPNGSAIGGRFNFGGRPAKPEDWPVIVGVVKDVPHNGVEEKSGNPFVYQLAQGGRPAGLTMFVRTNRPTGDAVSALRDKVRAIDPASPLFDVGVLQEAVDSSFDNRRAIGASRGQIVSLVLRQGLWKGGIGIALGLIGAALLSTSMTTLLFNVRPTDPAVYAAVSFVLIGVAALASYLPARRASRIDPLVALRDE